jgi:hypothetical protein
LQKINENHENKSPRPYSADIFAPKQAAEWAAARATPLAANKKRVAVPAGQQPTEFFGLFFLWVDKKCDVHKRQERVCGQQVTARYDTVYGEQSNFGSE